MNIKKIFLSLGLLTCLTFSLSPVLASQASSSSSSSQEIEQEDTASLVKPLRFINFEAHTSLLRTPWLFRHLPFDAHLLINQHLAPDSVIFAGEVCHFQKLSSSPCAEAIDSLPVEELNEVLTHVLAFVNHPPEATTALAYYKNYLATLLASHGLGKTAENAAFIAATAAASNAANNATTPAAHKALQTAATNAIYNTAKIADANAAWNAAINAISRASSHKSWQVAGDAAVSSASYAARNSVWNAASNAAKVAATANIARQESFEGIAQHAYTEAEKAALGYLVKNTASIWQLAYKAAMDTLSNSLYELPSSPKLAAWTDRENAYLKPYLRVIDHAEKDFTKAYALEQRL